MSKGDKKSADFKALGKSGAQYDFEYNPDLLEVFSNKHPERDYWVTLDCFEFTSLCPVTGQPDLGRIYINYIPDRKLVESKSLKLYLLSFRNQGSFHEDVINIIMNDLIAAMKPGYIEVFGQFNSRGGIAIYPFASYCQDKYQELKKERFARYSPERLIN